MRTLSGLLGSGFIFLNSLGVPAGDPARFKTKFSNAIFERSSIRKNEFRPPSIIKYKF